jgi:molybdopterin synthase catalytic subunit
MPKFRVRLYAGLSELVGSREIEFTLPEGATVALLRERLGEAYPAVRSFLPVLVAAVDEEYVTPDHVLHSGDDVALIPPVSGGADV